MEDNIKELEKVTIVVPIYNSGKTLRNCLESIDKQIYSAIEVLLIDDGSTDESAVICHEFCEKNANKFYYIRQENGGPAKARNAGINKATGNYIGFVDSDDTIEPNMISEMCKKMTEYNADMVICSYFKETKSSVTKIKYKYNTGLYKNDKATDIALSLINDTEEFDIPPYSWVRLVRSSVLSGTKIKFADGLVRSEDYHFWVKVHFSINSLFIINEPLYHYVENSSSITHTHVQHYWDDVKFIYSDLLISLPKDNEIHSRLGIMFLRRAMIALNNATRCISFKCAFKEISQITYDERIDLVLHELDKNQTKRYKLFPVLMKYNGKWIVLMKYMVRFTVQKIR